VAVCERGREVALMGRRVRWAAEVSWASVEEKKKEVGRGKKKKEEGRMGRG
jgi:hypothetical protein